MQTAFIISQVLAGVGLIFDLISFQLKERKKILACFSVTALLLSVHYLLLKQYAGAGMTAVSLVSFAFAMYAPEKKYLILVLIFRIIVFIFLYKYAYDLILLLAQCIFIFGSFLQNDRSIRLITMIGTSLTVLFASLAGSPTHALLELIFLSGNIVGYVRFYIISSPQLPEHQ